MLLICETHPVQYHAPVYQALQKQQIDFQVLYGSNFSVTGYQDAEFQASFAWDTDLCSGYRHHFLGTIEGGGACTYDELTGNGIRQKLVALGATSVMGLGYRSRFDRSVISAAKSLKLPLLLRTEASDTAISRSRLKAWVRDWILRRLYRRCAGLLYVGTNAKNQYQRLGVPGRKLFFSPYCVSTEAFKCSEVERSDLRVQKRKELGATDDTLVIIFCGKLSKRKGVDILLQATKILPEIVRRRVLLLFVGDGVLRQDLLNLATQAPMIAVHFAGFQNQTALSPYYHAADFAILPSVYSETWGLVVNEALHHGVPCLVSNRVGCAPDLIQPGTTGGIFAANSVSALAEAIQHCLPTLGDAEIRFACRKHVSNYSVELAALGITSSVAALPKNTGSA